MDTTEIVKVLVSPGEKLIDAISGAIGKAYEPRHIRKMAEAKAYELKLISDAVRNNSDIPIVYDSTGVAIDTSNYEEIAKRASSRLAYQEILKQQNIESVVDSAYEELENANDVSPDPVDPDWILRFFNSIENINSEDMQKLWGHILAGEIKRPNTYSYRTLEKLRNITQQEAEHFQFIASYALTHQGKKFLINECDILKRNKIFFGRILELEECGLMSAQNLTLTLSTSSGDMDYIFNSEVIGVIKGTKEDTQDIVLSVYVFTESGSQLINAIQSAPNSQYFIECLELIRENNKDFVVTAHRINHIDDKGVINFNKENIL